MLRQMYCFEHVLKNNGDAQRFEIDIDPEFYSLQRFNDWMLMNLQRSSYKNQLYYFMKFGIIATVYCPCSSDG